MKIAASRLSIILSQLVIVDAFVAPGYVKHGMYTLHQHRRTQLRRSLKLSHFVICHECYKKNHLVDDYEKIYNFTHI